MKHLIFLSIIISTVFSYSIHYYSNTDGSKVVDVVNSGLSTFRDAPSAEHVADIYARVSGLHPILSEGRNARF